MGAIRKRSKYLTAIIEITSNYVKLSNDSKYVIEGFLETISSLIPSLIFLLFRVVLNPPLFKLKSIVNVKPSMISLSILIYIVGYVIVLFVIFKTFDKSIKMPRQMAIKAVGWLIAVIMLFVFNDRLFTNLDVLPETIISIAVVILGNIFAYHKRL